MRLIDIRRSISDITAYDPDLLAYNNIIDRLVDNEYRHLWTMCSGWTFAVKESTVIARGDVVPTGTTSVTVTLGSANVTATAALFVSWMEGQTFIGLDGRDYVIQKIVSSTALVLTSPYLGPTLNGKDVCIRQDWILLPTDCVKVLALLDPSGTQILEYRSRYNQDPVDVGFSGNDPGTGIPQWWIPHDPAYRSAPVVAPTAAPTVGGTATAGVYSFVYTLTQNGVESPPSPAATMTLAAAGSITVTVPNTGTDSGIRKNIYATYENAVGTVRYKAYRFVSLLQETITSAVFATPIETAWTYSSVTRAPEHDGHVQRIRVFSRSESDITLTIRYLFDPGTLTEDNDAPLFPAANHAYLVYKVLEHVYVRHKDTTSARLYAKRAEEELDTLRRRYLGEERQPYRRGLAWGTGTKFDPGSLVLGGPTTFTTTP